MSKALLALNTTFKQRWIEGDPDVHFNVCEVLGEAWGDFITPLSGKDSFLTLGHLEGVLYYYIKDVDPTQVMPLEESGKILAEEKVTFDWPRLLPSGQVELIQVTGIPDIPALVAGEKCIVDWKCTKSYISDYWAMKFSKIGHQLRTYTALLRHRYGIEVTAARVDGIHMGKNATNSSFNGTRRRLFGPYRFTEAQLEETWEWYKSLMDVREFYEKEGVWPQNELACKDFGGCEYLYICQQPTKIQQRAAIIQEYRERVDS